MSKKERFEDVEAWRMARQLTKRIYILSNDTHFSRDVALGEEMRRASVSIMSNIAEGFERDEECELHRYLVIAKGATGRVKTQLYVALDTGLIEQISFDSLYKITAEIGRLIAELIKKSAERLRDETLRETRFIT